MYSAGEAMAPGPAHLLIDLGPALFAKKALTVKNYLKIEKKGLAHDRNIFLAPGPATHKTGTGPRQIKEFCKIEELCVA